MNLSVPFIRRPVATFLIACAALLAGIVAYRQLPAAALPRVDFPVILVVAHLPGADPETMATAVSSPLIKEFSTVGGLRTTTATNTYGIASLTLEFSLARRIDDAAVDVQAAIAKAQPHLPSEMPAPPSYRKFNPADAPVVLIAFRSDSEPLEHVDDMLRRTVIPALSGLDGVAHVGVAGSRKRALRIQVDPYASVAKGLGIDSLARAITGANDDAPLGEVRGGGKRFPVIADTQFRDAAAFAQLIVASQGGRPIRLGDVARVSESVEDEQSATYFDGQPALVVAVHRRVDANSVEVADLVTSRLRALRDEIGGQITIDVVSDQSVSVRESIRDVQFSFALACALVMLVIILFTRRLVPALVAGVALPLSLCGTFIGMWVLGFSLNNVTLLALTLAVGLVVDDAIVMLENIQRQTDRGMSPRLAAEKGAAEIGFTVISLTASLIAVFIPVLFMGGLIGRMLNEFGVTVALALGMSALVALFVTPTLAGSLLAASPGRPRRASKVPFLHFYEATLPFALRFRFLVVLAFIATVVGTVFLAKSLPKGFFPREDLGQVVVTTEAQQDVSFEAMVSLQAEVEEALRRSPHVAHVVNQIGSAAGGGHLHQGRLIVELRPRQQRGDLDQVLDDLRLRTSEVPELSSVVTSLQNMRGGRQGRSHYQLTLQSPDFQELAAASRRVVAAMSGDPSFVGVASDLQNEATHAVLRIDREKARLLGIRADHVRMALQHGFAENHLASFTRGGEVHKVLIEFDRRLIGSERALETLYVQSTDGPLVPISAFATVELTSGPSAINQTGVVPSVAISFDLAKGVSLGQAVHRIERIKDASAFPGSVASSFTGTAKAFQESLSNQGWLLLAALLAMYLVLGILYESFIHPFTILAGVPSAAMGALVALHWAGLSLDAPALIGVLLLIGIAKKNAILIVDAALDRQRLGVSAEEAILQACRQRFRPIMMTTFAATAGVVPIAFGLGAGSELRQPLGVAVLGGLAVSQVLTLYLTPVLFLFFDSLSRRFRRLPVSGAGPSVRSTT